MSFEKKLLKRLDKIEKLLINNLTPCCHHCLGSGRDNICLSMQPGKHPSIFCKWCGGSGKDPLCHPLSSVSCKCCNGSGVQN